MAEIKFHPDDRVMSGLEVAKNGGYFVVGLLIFEVMFYAMYLEGEEIPALLCGIPPDSYTHLTLPTNREV